MLELSEPRGLVCGSRHWPWPQSVGAVLDRLASRYGQDLAVIEGAATGADRAAHDWCGRHGLGADRHPAIRWAGQPRSGLAPTGGGWPARNATCACC
ncbi:SLOG family protein [Streptomyces sp. NPDC046685]|uniref:SLOG family protein n=1 Tax=Streptomyces sp. NPDC046685 TaxID=3157202 RepID=UPI0033F0ACD8